LHTKTIFELLHEAGKAITSEIELEKVAQRVTDIGTELIGAQFGAFFYNVVNRDGESLMLYTISGVAKEAFSKFPMPRNTQIFDHTFSAKGTVRYEDVTKHPHYGKNLPYHGMPKGHLPVKSYLAVPVVSPITREVIGSLFFGHSEAGVFTEESEKLIEGMAIQTEIAFMNAKLFEEKKQVEQKLLEQKEQYQSIFNASSESIIIYDEYGYIAEANPAACKIFGYSYEELVGLHASKLFQNPGDFEVLKEFAFSGRQYSGTNIRVRKDGTQFEVEFRGSRFIFKGKPHVMSVVKDITSEKKVEEALLKSENFSQLISNISPTTLWLTNQEGVTIYINQTWMDWVGGSLEEHLYRGWLKAVVPEDRKNAGEVFSKAFAARKIFSTDFRIVRRDGDIRWCSTYGSPYFHNDGSFGGYAGSLIDITERKFAEERLESQNVLINTITNNTRQALFLMDDKQFCTYMNPAAEEMTGYKLHEVQERPLHYYIHHTYPDGRHFSIEECPIDNALPAKNQVEGEEIFIHKDGHFYPVAFIASPIIENGIPKGTVIEVRNTTEEKRLQQELRNKEKEAMEMLEQKVKERTSELEKMNYELLQFTSVASHDLKEPVRKIAIFSKMLQEKLDESLDSSSKKRIDVIISSAERMARLIDDLLNFSRLSQAKVHFEQVDLNNLLLQICDDLEILIKEKEATIQFDNLPVVEGISFQLGQIFQNLISNSIKFSHPERQPVITVYSENVCIDDNCFYKISYKDNGIGFKPEYSVKIFEIFQRLHSRDQFEGTGVGLAIVKKIVELHKGKIKASGIENEGALFEILLPVHQ
jgi:PAS domain S-box-containing protein